MKKRLLSAALALAMVLTLLPVSAFAVDPEPSTPETSTTPNTTTPAEPAPEVPAANDAAKAPAANGPAKAPAAPAPRDAAPAPVSGTTRGQYFTQAEADATPKKNGVSGAGWYYVTQTSPETWYGALGYGVVNTTSNSGTWYSDLATALSLKIGNIKLIGDQNMAGSSVSASATIDLNGYNVTASSLLVPGAFTLTFNDSTYTSGAPTKKVATNITVGAADSPQNGKVVLNNVHLTGSVEAYFNNSTCAVEVNNSIVGGNVLLHGTSLTNAASTGGTITVSGANASVAQAVRIDHLKGGQRNGTNGKVVIKDGATVTGPVEINQSSGDGVVSVSGGGKVTTGGITVTQDSGSNTVSVTGSGSAGGNITVTQTTGGSINVSSGATAGAVSINSTAGPTVTVDNATVTGVTAQGDGAKVNVLNRGFVNRDVGVAGRISGLKDGEASTLATPTVTVDGGTIKGTIKKAVVNPELLTNDFTVDVKGSGMVGAINLWRSAISVTGATTGTVTLNSGSLTVGNDATVGDVTLGSQHVKDGAAGPQAIMKVTGYGNTIGAISEATPNNAEVVLTIPGVTKGGENPNKNDTNKIKSVTLNAVNVTKINKAKSSIAGGHYQTALTGEALTLLPDYIAYLVKENGSTGKNGSYQHSYWADSELLMNDLAAMTKTITGITAKGAIDSTSGVAVDTAKILRLYMYDPRTVGVGDPAQNPALPSNSAKRLLSIKFPEPTTTSITSITLPSVVGSNRSITWYPLEGKPSGEDLTSPNLTIDTDGTKYAGGRAVTPKDTISYVSNDVSYKVTKVLNVQVAVGSNSTVKAKLSGSNIVLSGLAQIGVGGNAANIPLELETDAIEKVRVNAVWNPLTKDLSFSDPTSGSTLSEQTGGAMEIYSDTTGSYIRIVENNTKIGLSTSSLTQYTLSVDIQGNTGTSLGGMTTTVKAPELSGNALKEALAKAMTVPATSSVGASNLPAGNVDFSTSPTVQQEFGTYIAKLNQTTLNSQLRKVQEDKYQEWYKKTNPGKSLTQAQLSALTENELVNKTGYNTIAVVLYMNVEVTSFKRGNDPYTMTATMTPYARVEAQSTKYAWNDATKDYAPVVVVNGTSLGTLDSGNVGKIKVTLPEVQGAFNQTAAMTPAPYVHQNATYVADVDNTGAFYLQHTAANGAGFGTIVLNETKPLAEVQEVKTAPSTGNTWGSYSPKKLYDSVQAAVNDTKNGEKIIVDDTVNSSTKEYPIDVTGRARTFYINVTGNQKITRANNASGVVITQPTGNQTEYTVQLTKDNVVVKPTEKPIPISVSSAVGGAASVSASRADEGDTITVTLTPATNYRVGGVTVTAAVKNSSTGVTTNTTVATTAASANSWRFVVPTGATSVTVTPSFVATSTGATVTVSSATGGTATTSAGTNRVAPGSTVSVTTVPSSGYRTMGLVVTSNTGSATATRTGVNSYVFTVPAGSTNVVVTPRFDVNNGTVFEDVWSTEYFSSAVAWAVGRGVTNGTDTYHFSPYNNCTRADMVTFLYRAAGSPAVGNVANPFWDVQPGSYYYNAVLWAVSKGITNGVSANQFGVNQIVTRAQAVTFLHRYNGSPAPASGNRFYDVPAREYYANAVAWATGKGVTNGTSTTLFSPNQAVTRAQAVAFLYRDFNNVRA